jgi:hypothetical protein
MCVCVGAYLLVVVVWCDMFDDYDGGDDGWKGRRGRGRGASEWWQGWRIKNGHVDEDEQAQEKRGGASGRSPSAVPLRPSGGATYKPTCLTPLDSSLPFPPKGRDTYS